MIYNTLSNLNQRQQVSYRRLQMLEGDWLSYLTQHTSEKLEITRMINMGLPSTSINLYKTLIDKISSLYNQDPIVTNPDLSPDQSSYLSSFDLFRKHQKLNRYVVGLRDAAIKIDWHNEDHLAPAGPSLRLLTPDTFEVCCHMDTPTIPFEIKELRCRMIDKREVYCYDVYSVEDPSNPHFRVVGTDKKDYTQYLINNNTYPYLENGQPYYPFIDPDNNPYLPFAFYHASESTSFFSPYELEELVEATLDIALDWSFYRFCLLQSSWNQRYMVDCDLLGLKPDPDGRSQHLVVDPTSILQLSSRGENGSGQLGQMESPSDLKSIAESIMLHIGSIRDTLGIKVDATIQAQSGLSLAIKNDDLREIQKQYTNHFRQGDLELLKKTSLINNLYSPTQLPVDGYSISYPSIPLSTDELTSKFEYQMRLLEAKLTTKEDMLQVINPGMTREEAEAKILEIEGPAILEPVKTAEALNGAQVTSALDIVTKAALNQLPRESAVAMLQLFFNLPEEAAEKIIGNIGTQSQSIVVNTAPNPQGV